MILPPQNKFEFHRCVCDEAHAVSTERHKMNGMEKLIYRKEFLDESF
jgi:hypothetical protein